MTSTNENIPRGKNFVERLKNNKGGATHIIKTYDFENRKCWFLLKAGDVSLKKLAHTSFDEIIDLTSYGEVLASGWGHDVPEENLPH